MKSRSSLTVNNQRWAAVATILICRHMQTYTHANTCQSWRWYCWASLSLLHCLALLCQPGSTKMKYSDLIATPRRAPVMWHSYVLKDGRMVDVLFRVDLAIPDDVDVPPTWELLHQKMLLRQVRCLGRCNFPNFVAHVRHLLPAFQSRLACIYAHDSSINATTAIQKRFGGISSPCLLHPVSGWWLWNIPAGAVMSKILVVPFFAILRPNQGKGFCGKAIRTTEVSKTLVCAACCQICQHVRHRLNLYLSSSKTFPNVYDKMCCPRAPSSAPVFCADWHLQSGDHNPGHLPVAALQMPIRTENGCWWWGPWTTHFVVKVWKCFGAWQI